MVGIRFKPCGKLYDFETAGVELKPGDFVVVESELGLSIGKVVCKSRPAGPGAEYKKVMRLASEEDIRESRANAELEKEAFAFCRERVMARGLQMKLIRTEATLDRKRVIFYFIAEKRIDFRELVKDLAQKFRTRIEMRQVGVRDEAKMTGGLGLCGRQLCCTSFLVDFAPISIKMAKKQELVLNTGKLSGICGRLMCCLSYEYGCKGQQAVEEPEEALTGDNPEETPATPEVRVHHARPDAAVAGARKTRRFERGLRRERHTEAGRRTEKDQKQEPLTPEPETAGAQVPGQDAGSGEPGNGNPPAHRRRRKKRWKKRGHNGGHDGTQQGPETSGNEKA